jgi:hypothetical protein
LPLPGIEYEAEDWVQNAKAAVATNRYERTDYRQCHKSRKVRAAEDAEESDVVVD